MQLATLADLHRLWMQYREFPGSSPELNLQIGELILKRGEPILAYDVLSRNLARLNEKSEHRFSQQASALRFRQLLCLALAQSGATKRARERLEQLCADGDESPETLGLLGRVYKDIAIGFSTNVEKTGWLHRSFDCYRRGFEKGEAAYRNSASVQDSTDACYCGINAAAVSVLCGKLRTAQSIAARVRLIASAPVKNASITYWNLATLGEANLILGHFEESRRWYCAAVELAGKNWRELASTRRQLFLLLPHLEQSPDDWDYLFPAMVVGIVASSEELCGDCAANSGSVSRLKAELDRITNGRRLIAVYMNLLSHGDVLLGESFLKLGMELHIVLTHYRDFYAELFLSKAWHQRLTGLLAGAASVVEGTERSCLDDRVNMEFAALRAYGAAALRAKQLDAELACWVVNGCDTANSAACDGFLVRHWKRLGCTWAILTFPIVALDRSPQSESEPSKRPEPTGSHEILAMLFADVKNYSKLKDAMLLRFSQVFIGEIARVLDDFTDDIRARRTAGDGLFLVFSNIEVAVETAFALRNRIAGTRWDTFGLPANLAMRISLDAGPVYTYQDAVMRRPDICGTYVNRAARIEPVTPPNEVYASEAFASLYVAGGGKRFRFDYVGQTELPKGFGLTPLYCLS